jgi:hypothetical protein
MKKFVLGATLLGLFGSNAFASLILIGSNTTPTIDITGTGLGAVNTVLTLQSPNSTSNETGCVAPGNVTTGCGFTDSTVLTGAGQIGTPMLSSLGIVSGQNIGVVLNAAEPGNDLSITVNSIVLTLYGTSTTRTFSTNQTYNLTATATGTGASGYLFALDDAQAAQATTFLTANPTARAGIGTSISNATGGNETFFIFNRNLQQEPTGVPEPTSLALMSVGLIAVGLFRRK